MGLLDILRCNIYFFLFSLFYSRGGAFKCNAHLCQYQEKEGKAYAKTLKNLKRMSTSL